jgi:5'-3' exonuclease
MYQLLSNHVEVYDDLKNRAVTQAELSEFYVGCTPRDIIGLKALMGDCSDNVPGLPGMGEGTALEVLRHVEGYKGVVQMSKKGGRYPLPDPEDFEKKIRFRVAKAFADPIAARKILRRNLKLVRIPKTLEKLPVSIRQEFVSQLTETPAVMHHEIEIALKKYQINSIMGRVEAWMKPLVVAGRI